MIYVNLNKKHNHMKNRRSFIKTVATGSLASAVIGCENSSIAQRKTIPLGMKRLCLGVLCRLNSIQIFIFNFFFQNIIATKISSNVCS